MKEIDYACVEERGSYFNLNTNSSLEKPIEKLYYHEPTSELDKHYVTVQFDDGSYKRFFNIIAVEWSGDA